MRTLISTICLSLSLSACTTYENRTNISPIETVSKQNVTEATKNIIMIVGDGMGPAYTTAYRYFNDDPTTQEVEKTVFDRNFVGMASTYPARVSGYVTDSAAGATALATGFKSYNGAISVNINKQPVETVLE